MIIQKWNTGGATLSRASHGPQAIQRLFRGLDQNTLSLMASLEKAMKR